MKKKLLLIASALMLIFSTTFAKEAKDVPEKIVKDLNQEFSSPANVNWNIFNDYYKATFSVDDQQYTAVYDANGELKAVSRKLTVSQLPMALIKDVKDMQANYTVAELFELKSDNGTQYYITYQNDKGTKTFVSDGEYWSRYNL